MASPSGSVSCPVCDGAATAILVPRPHSVLRCLGCTHRFLLPSEAEADYEEGYAGFLSDPTFSERLRLEVQREFLPRIAPPARILDVGCGNGDFLAIAREKGYSVVGVDVSHEAVRLTQARGIEAFRGDFLALELHADFDFVTFWDVLEHLPAPRPFIERAFELLLPGGYLIVKTPRVQPLEFALACRWPRLRRSLLQMPGHSQFYTRESLLMLLRGAEANIRTIGAMRHPPSPSLKRRVARTGKRALHRAAGSGNFYVFAQKSGAGRA